MKLYIQVENGNTVNHPALEENLFQAFGEIPDNWKPFIRVSSPTLGIYEVLESQNPTYEFVDGVWTDVWHKRNMTQEEKTQKQDAVKDIWNNRPNRENFAAWTFDEDTCSFVAPTPKPTDGKEYFWDGTTNSWREVIQP